MVKNIGRLQVCATRCARACMLACGRACDACVYVRVIDRACAHVCGCMYMSESASDANDCVCGYVLIASVCVYLNYLYKS